MAFDKEQDYLDLLIESTGKVKIPVEHPGVLEVPEGKNVEDLPYSHFSTLVNKKGFAKIARALNNLHVWNKEKNPTLASWANKMEDRLANEFKED